MVGIRNRQVVRSAPADTKRVVIAGGRAAGLSAAYTLKKRGLTSTLIEAENHVGGAPRLTGSHLLCAGVFVVWDPVWTRRILFRGCLCVVLVGGGWGG